MSSCVLFTGNSAQLMRGRAPACRSLQRQKVRYRCLLAGRQAIFEINPACTTTSPAARSTETGRDGTCQCHHPCIHTAPGLTLRHGDLQSGRAGPWAIECPADPASRPRDGPLFWWSSSPISSHPITRRKRTNGRHPGCSLIWQKQSCGPVRSSTRDALTGRRKVNGQTREQRAAT